ncbi:MAG: UDP-N-acetylmuramoylalanyl-D-glutamyl-2,6-diaminopimelate--D-alanyl-D-alanine ligase [Azospirillum sp.]|nr:UDP-N-acetylmuramoylalanyl-D-glutamyl-2,6-diaminopimelate--D-alanyl-D-alanine ligase [Azospirillum sp.]
MSAGDHNPVLWMAETAAVATGGRASGAWRATGVSIDSRSLAPGDLFVALHGPNHDGHDHVAAALAKGAAAAVVERVPAALGADAPLLLVKDTQAGLERLGVAARARSSAQVIAVTGSVGKTGTKEALKTCLSTQGSTYATAGSLNNHWGVPLSLARLPADAAFGVFELGMNHAGEIGPLSRQVSPQVAVITTVEPAHLEFFGSVEAIADAKAEIFEGMSPQGAAILNRDNPHFGRLAAAARKAGLGRVWSFGAHDQADARVVDCSIHATCSAVSAVIGRERLQYCISLPGRHWVINSLGVLLAVKAAGADPVSAARALSQLTAVKGRGTRARVRLAQGTVLVIDESYNASPIAMEAAFQVLAKIDPGAGGRRIAVLGDMLEMGSRSSELHAALAPSLLAAGIDLVFTCGAQMEHLHHQLPPARRGDHAPDSSGLAEAVAGSVRGGDVVLIKGSAGSRMGRVVAALEALDRAADAVASESGPARRCAAAQ